MHQHGQKVDVHVEDNSDSHTILRGRLSQSYYGDGSVCIVMPNDRRVTIPESRILYIEEVRSSRDES